MSISKLNQFIKNSNKNKLLHTILHVITKPIYLKHTI